LKDFVGGPVWVLGKNEPHSEQAGFKVSPGSRSSRPLGPCLVGRRMHLCRADDPHRKRLHRASPERRAI
jgi:hypothetical protein